jgi:ferredoxin
VCRTTAPENFEANEDEGYSFVNKQPENDEEIEQMDESMESCPVEAIGNDG